MKQLDEQVFNDNKEGASDEEEKEKPKEDQHNPKVDESLKTFKFHKDFVLNVNFHPTNSAMFCSCSGDDTAAIWDLGKTDPLFTLKGHKDTISFASFNYEGNLLATGSMDGSIKIWDCKTGKVKYSLDGPSDEIRVFNIYIYLFNHKIINFVVYGLA